MSKFKKIDKENPPKPIIVDIIEPKPKMGRPTPKKEGVIYKRLSVEIELNSIEQMKDYLEEIPRKDRPNQNQFVEKAILEYIANNPL